MSLDGQIIPDERRDKVEKHALYEKLNPSCERCVAEDRSDVLPESSDSEINWGGNSSGHR